MENKDCYDLLGIDRNTSEFEIKRAYKQLAKKYHPDLNKDIGAIEKFIEIQYAYKELLNPKIENSFFTIFGIESWEDIIKQEDFNINPPNKIRIDVDYNYDNFNEDMDNITKLWNIIYESKEYKEFKWAINKIKLLNKLYYKIIQYNYYKDKIDYYKDKIDVSEIINHLQKVLDNKIDVKEKIIKPIEMKGYYKLGFDIQNQFHPKFINKFPMKIQIFIRNKIRDLINRLSIRIK